MNKTALKNFATWSRRKLIEQVQTKALLYGINEKNGLHIEEQFGQLLINGQTYPLSMKPAFVTLQKQLEQKGYKQLLEEAAYTWFNRIIAIRYMEVHEYLPERVNVLSSSAGRVDPDILFEFDTMDLNIKIEEIRELVNAGNTEAAYRILFVAQCNALNCILPFMFEPIQDYTELLLPDFLLDAESVIKILVQNEELTESFAEIEVIGWLYQYYIAEEKDRVFAQKSKYKKEEIPFATQLFTPKWIVQYMVQNSLGRYWTEAHREDEDLIDNWEYFIKHEEEEFHEKIAPYVKKELKVEDIKLLDPAMGSGHILVYAFEVFHEIYEKCGYPERDIPRLILENNLYGLDIDDRAYQLSAFAVVMKAAQYSRRFLRSIEREGIQLNLASIQEMNHISEDVIAYIAQQEVGEQYNQVQAFFDQYHNAKTYGSLINITEREIAFIEERFEQIENYPVEDLFYGEQHEIAKQILPVLIHQMKIMRNEYDVVVMNPPYMGASSMNEALANFLVEKYQESKVELYTAFILKGLLSLSRQGLLACVTMHSWTTLTSFEKVREFIIDNKTIDSLMVMDNGVMGIAFNTSATIFRNYKIKEFKSNFTEVKYKNLSKEGVPYEFPIRNNINGYQNVDYFKSIITKPLLFGINENALKNFEFQTFNQLAPAKKGMDTNGDSSLYIRYWFEVNLGEIYSVSKDKDNAKWFELNKGGGFKKWYGNNLDVVLYQNNGFKLKNKKKKANIRNEEYYFKESITYGVISSYKSSFRYSNEYSLFDQGGPNIFPESNLLYTLALCNSSVIEYLLKYLAPTMNLTVGDINKLPLILPNKTTIVEIENKVLEIIKICKEDWDSQEISIDFKNHPFMDYTDWGRFDIIYAELASLKGKQREQIKMLEEEINKIIIKLYNLEEVVDYRVAEQDITLSNYSLKQIVKNFLSYYIGVYFGRFKEQSKVKIILHVTEKEYFNTDIITDLREFIANNFGKDTVDENMQWLAEALEMKNGEDAESRLRRYFLDEFFTDHCKMYQKRPIYWLVDSGKQKGLRTLIYMHRYQSDTMATIRFEHLQEIQAKYQQEIADLENRLVNPNLSATDKKKLNAEKVLFEKKIDELREFDKRLAAIAAEEIEIDLDDGVKVNYEKFYRGGKGVLAKIK